MAYEGNGHRHNGTDARTAAYNTEHWLAWLFGLGAVVLGAIGLLYGFGLIGTTGGELLNGGEFGTGEGVSGSFQGGMIWLLTGLTSGLLAMALHQSGHHRSTDPDALPDSEKGFYFFEHGAAYLFGAMTVVAGALAVLVGFDVFDQGWVQEDGLLWAIAGVVGGVLTMTLHTVTHHQRSVPDEDVIIGVVERRIQEREPVGTRR